MWVVDITDISPVKILGCTQNLSTHSWSGYKPTNTHKLIHIIIYQKRAELQNLPKFNP